MKDLTELRELKARLKSRFNRTQVDGVMGDNWIEFLSRSLPDKRGD
jgi:microsomal dipeptidase-like Zn-dependent dipeptidase